MTLMEPEPAEAPEALEVWFHGEGWSDVLTRYGARRILFDQGRAAAIMELERGVLTVERWTWKGGVPVRGDIANVAPDWRSAEAYLATADDQGRLMMLTRGYRQAELREDEEAALEVSLVAPGLPAEPAKLASTHLRIAGELIARRAWASSARQYAMTYATFCDWLGAQLSRPPLVGDLTADTVAAYARHLELAGGRGGGPASPATRRQRLVLIRALARKLGLEAAAAQILPLSHRQGPPETLIDTEYANLIRAPDGRTRGGRRDRAILRVLGDCGLRNAELRARSARCLRRPRSNSRHHSLSTCLARAMSSARSPCPPRPMMPYAAGWTPTHMPAPAAPSPTTSCSSAAWSTAEREPPAPTAGSQTAPWPRSLRATHRAPGSPPASLTPTRCAPTTPPPWPPKASPSTASPDALGMPPSKPPAATWPKPSAASPPWARSSTATISTQRAEGYGDASLAAGAAASATLRCLPHVFGLGPVLGSVSGAAK